MIASAIPRRDILAGTAALVAGAPAFAQAPAKKILRVVPQADPPTLDPVFGNSWVALIHGTMIYESLFAPDSQLRPKPQMTESWTTSPDGLVWGFTLREHLKFHDGQPLTTADVIPSMQRWMSIDPIGAKVGAVTAGLTAVDTRTFEWRLTRPYPNMLLALAAIPAKFAAIMRAGDLKDPAKRVETSVGSGPFRFVHAERVSGARLVYERNPDYVPRSEPADGLSGGRVVKVDRVEWQIIPDPSTAATALQAGEVDFVEKPSFDLLPTLAKHPQVRLKKLTELASSGMLCTNWLAAPFTDKRARQALSYIVDQTEILQGAFGEDPQWYRPCNSYFVCGSPYGSSAGTEDFKPDLPRAKALLAAAGYKGEKLVFPTTKDISWLGQMAEVVAGQLQAAGLNVELVFRDWATTVGLVNKQDASWNLFVTAAPGPITFNPATNLGTNMACDRKNFVGWPCDPDAEKLRQAFLEADEAARPAALEALHRHLAGVQPYHVIGQSYQPVGYRSNLTGVLASPVAAYWNIEKT